MYVCACMSACLSGIYVCIWLNVCACMSSCLYESMFAYDWMNVCMSVCFKESMFSYDWMNMFVWVIVSMCLVWRVVCVCINEWMYDWINVYMNAYVYDLRNTEWWYEQIILTMYSWVCISVRMHECMNVHKYNENEWMYTCKI